MPPFWETDWRGEDASITIARFNSHTLKKIKQKSESKRKVKDKANKKKSKYDSIYKYSNTSYAQARLWPSIKRGNT